MTQHARVDGEPTPAPSRGLLIATPTPTALSLDLSTTRGELVGIGGVYAIEVAETGGPEVLAYVEKPQPSPSSGEVLIKAEAIGVNFVDTYFRSGLYPHELPFVLGAEVCGTVEAVGDGVPTVLLGDRVATADASAPTPNTALHRLISLCRSAP
jgi:Alcohol dehydrogenase GroES-like domain